MVTTFKADNNGGVEEEEDGEITEDDNDDDNDEKMVVDESLVVSTSALETDHSDDDGMMVIDSTHEAENTEHSDSDMLISRETSVKESEAFVKESELVGNEDEEKTLVDSTSSKTSDRQHKQSQGFENNQNEGNQTGVMTVLDKRKNVLRGDAHVLGNKHYDGNQSRNVIEREAFGEQQEKEEVSDDNNDDDDEINWDSTLYLPEPHLITVKQFNDYFPSELVQESVRKIVGLLKDDNPPKQQSSQNQEKRINPFGIQKKRKDINPSKQKKKRENDIFETTDSSALSTKVFDDFTKYQTLCKEPKYSSINLKDRKWYRWYINHLKNSNMNVVAPYESRFKDLLQGIQKEQSEFMQHLYNCFMKDPAEYFFISPTVKDFLKERNMNQVNDLLKTSKNLYSLKQTINMKQMPQSTVQIKFGYVECVKPQKNVPPLKISSLNTPLKIPSTFNLGQVQTDTSAAKQLSVKNGAPIYINQSALLAIMESLVSPTKEWLIPVTVERNSGGINNFIHCSQPHPRRNFGVREANRLYYKNCFTQFLCENDNMATPPESGVHMFVCGQHKLLVESHIDAIDEHSKETYSMDPKIEFQPSIGFEQFSIADLCYFWWQSRLTNTKHIVCHRVDPRNNCIRRLDTYTRESLCGPGCPYNPVVFFNHLNCLLDILITLQPGEYLLEHASGNAFFFLFEVSQRGFTTLETKYKDIKTGKSDLIIETQVSASWLQIDTNIQPIQALEILPWLFQSPLSNIELIPLGKRANPIDKLKNRDQKKNKRKQNKLAPMSFVKQKKETENHSSDEPLPPGVDRLSPTVEPLPPGTEPPPPGVEVSSSKKPVVYTYDEEGEFEDF